MDIGLKNTDKVSATVVMSREQYVAEVMKHLQNQHQYEKLLGIRLNYSLDKLKHF